MDNLRVAAYCRVSTEKDEQQNSLNNQKKYFQEYIMNHEGWTLTKVYYDEGISGTLAAKRQGFQTMISHALDGQIDLILTKEVSRFARNTVDTLAYTRQLRSEGVGVIFTIDHIDTREPDGELRLTIMASIAQEESRKTSERVKWGQRRRMEQGVVFGRNLLGYQVRDGKLTIHEAEAPIVRAIFHKYTNEGKGMQTIARELGEEGMCPMRSQIWSNTVILRILKNEKYVGDLCQKKTFTPNYLTHQKKKNNGEEDKIYITDHHPPIITRNMWNRTQEELKRRSSDGKPDTRYSCRYWCSGKIICGECGAHYSSRRKKLKNGEIYKFWRCRSAINHGRRKEAPSGSIVGCDSDGVSERVLLTCVKHGMDLLMIDREEVKKEVIREIKAVGIYSPGAAESSKAAREIEQLEKKKQEAIHLVLEGLITREDLRQQLEDYDRAVKKLQRGINMKEEQDRILSYQVTRKEKYQAVLDEVMTFHEANEQLYGEVVDRIFVYKNHIMEIRMHGLHLGLRLYYSTSGRGINYKTDIIRTEWISG